MLCLPLKTSCKCRCPTCTLARASSSSSAKLNSRSFTPYTSKVMEAQDTVQSLKGVGDAVAKLYGRLGIHTLGQLIDYYPRTYDDFSHTTPIAQLRPGMVTVKATIGQVAG